MFQIILSIVICNFSRKPAAAISFVWSLSHINGFALPKNTPTYLRMQVSSPCISAVNRRDIHLRSLAYNYHQPNASPDDQASRSTSFVRHLMQSSAGASVPNCSADVTILQHIITVCTVGYIIFFCSQSALVHHNTSFCFIDVNRSSIIALGVSVGCDYYCSLGSHYMNHLLVGLSSGSQCHYPTFMVFYFKDLDYYIFGSTCEATSVSTVGSTQFL